MEFLNLRYFACDLVTRLSEFPESYVIVRQRC